ncbi:hypothetical protein DPMN_052881 [Dreissena polymorpha]|uniref:Uncharacterized protein n=1 Tax=Dreissena polymorpha TaxID=45954 RepID=A0A9D4CLQ2_DREPO|nr:hypothetical protein DPMN_052881 [Dreissena polymorpha]
MPYLVIAWREREREIERERGGEGEAEGEAEGGRGRGGGGERERGRERDVLLSVVVRIELSSSMPEQNMIWYGVHFQKLITAMLDLDFE